MEQETRSEQARVEANADAAFERVTPENMRTEVARAMFRGGFLLGHNAGYGEALQFASDAMKAPTDLQ